jgi:hypothetical protein
MAVLGLTMTGEVDHPAEASSKPTNEVKFPPRHFVAESTKYRVLLTPRCVQLRDVQKSPAMACSLCGQSGARHLESCPRGPKSKDPIDCWVEYHLTDQGWISGNLKNQSGVHDRADNRPEGTVLSVKVSATEIGGERVGDIFNIELFRNTSQEARIRDLLARAPIPTRYRK